MLPLDVVDPEIDFLRHLTALERVRSSCENIVVVIPQHSDSQVWTGITEDVFNDNLAVMHQRACDALMLVDEAIFALRKAMNGTCLG
ncbi:MAG: hypothetical protein ACOH1J_04300 [Microbacteriaceae bacterium]